MRVCITGATGFIGQNLLRHLGSRSDLQIVALSRKLSPELNESKKGNIIWRRCNGFSLPETEVVLAEVDVLVYLIHSMLPSSSLTQGSFSDFDAYLADNFARSAKKNGVKKIIYLSGLQPQKAESSLHLKSRLEVENIFSQSGVSTVALRSGLIVGQNGSSFRILEKLVRRLPLSICPSWTLTKTQPIDLRDVLTSIEFTLDHHTKLQGDYDIGGSEILSYKEMLNKTATALNLKRWIINVPFFSPGLSKLWVSKVTSTPQNLVYPLVESLKHEMLVRDKNRLPIPNFKPVPFADSLHSGLQKPKTYWLDDVIDYQANLNFRWLKNVTSFQRVYVKEPVRGQDIAQQYFSWLGWFLRPLIRVIENGAEVRFNLLFNWSSLELLRLRKGHELGDQSRVTYPIVGGILADRRVRGGRLEFCYLQASNCVIVALLDFRPSLPWFVYKYTQAILHNYIMKSFARHLGRN